MFRNNPFSSMAPSSPPPRSWPHNRQLFWSLLSVFAAFFSLPHSHAVSGILATHGGIYGELFGHYPMGNLGNNKYFIEGDRIAVNASAEASAYYPGTTQLAYHDSAELMASVSTEGRSFFHLSASSNSITSGGTVPKSMAFVSASWRDIIYVDGQSPAKIRLKFELDGVLDAERSTIVNTGYEFAGSTLTTRLWDEILDPNNGSNNNAYWNVHEMFNTKSINGQINFTQTSTDSVAYSSKLIGFTLIDRPGSFPIISVTYDVPFKANYGGYAWSFWAAVGSSAGNGSAFADFRNTVKLVDVQDPFGNSIESSIRFDSGRNLNSSVPEPGSCALALLGAVGAAMASRARRRTMS